MCDDLKFRYPFSCIVSGISGSGKSTFCIRFPQKLDALCTARKFGGGIFWDYGQKFAVPSRQQLPANVSFNEDVPEDFGGAKGEARLVILDVLLSDVYSNQACYLSTRGTHLRNISVILIAHNLFYQGMFSRVIR